MKYARLIQQYKYDLKSWDKKGNLGDCIQNIAVENLYNEMGIKNPVKINRDRISEYKGEKVILPMQGWFGNVHNVFSADWSEDVLPVFIGFHLNDYKNNRKSFIEKGIDKKIKTYEPVGCRDRNTCNYLHSLGINAYFSGCLTLTFPKRMKEPQNGKIFLVDISPETEKLIPDEVRGTAEKITHTYYFKQYPVSKLEALEFENAAKVLLERYKNEAKLIITSRIHCAMPCIAMGIPVIFINKNTPDSRLDVLDGIIPKYSPEDIPIIDWKPKVPNIEELKTLIKENAKLQIKRKHNEAERILEKLDRITEELHQKGLKYIPHIHLKLLNAIEKYPKIMFYGASLFLKDVIQKYKINQKNIIGIIDNDPSKWYSKYGNYTIYPPDVLLKLNPDFILFTIKNNHNELYNLIKKNLEQNYPDIKMLPDIFETF